MATKFAYLHGMEEMTWNAIDLIIAIPLLLAAWRGFRKGLIIEIATLVGLVAGLFAGYHGADRVAESLADSWDLKASTLHGIGFLIAFAAVLVAVYLLGKVIEKAVDLVALGLVNKGLGALFGLVKMGLFLSVVIYFLNLAFGKDEWLPKEQVKQAVLYPVVSEAASWLVPEMSQKGFLECARKQAEDGLEHLREGADELRDAIPNR